MVATDLGGLLVFISGDLNKLLAVRAKRQKKLINPTPRATSCIVRLVNKGSSIETIWGRRAPGNIWSRSSKDRATHFDRST